MKTPTKTLSALAAGLLLSSGAAFAAPVELNGYFRSSAGSSDKGGNQVCFRLPGSAVWFRLGNECDLYAGLTLASELGKVDGTTFKSRFTFAQGTQQATNWEQSGVAFREAFVEAQDFGAAMNMPALKGSTLWVGKRFTPNADDFHMLDYNYWDGFWGGGAGISGVNLGFAKFDYSYLRTAQQNWDGAGVEVKDSSGNVIGTTSPFVGLGGFRPDLVDGGTATITTHAFRLLGIAVNPGGTLNFGLDLVRANNRGADPGDPDVPGKNGVTVTASHVQDNLLGLGGGNKLVLQVASGAGSLKMENVPAFNGTGRKAWSVFDQWTIEPAGSPFSMFAIAGYRNAEVDGVSGKNSANEWFVGVRPQYKLNNIWSLMSEIGHQQLEPETEGVKGDKLNMTKVTLGTQFSMGSSIWARPSLRFFTTYAKWNDATKAAGAAGMGRGPVCTGRDCDTRVNSFADKTSGLSYGVQVEAWF